MCTGKHRWPRAIPEEGRQGVGHTHGLESAQDTHHHLPGTSSQGPQVGLASGISLQKCLRYSATCFGVPFTIHVLQGAFVLVHETSFLDGPTLQGHCIPDVRLVYVQDHCACGLMGGQLPVPKWALCAQSGARWPAGHRNSCNFGRAQHIHPCVF